jgi:hypothetical protein
MKFAPAPHAEIVLVETAMSNNPIWLKPGPKITFLGQVRAWRILIGLKLPAAPNFEILLVDNVEILLVETPMSNNPECSKLGPKITFLGQITAWRNLIGLDKQTYKQTLTIFN